jgi:short-subunit dehydrogenase
MKLTQARVLLTGGGGGIGSAMAEALLARGACVLLVDRDAAALAAAARKFSAHGRCIGTFTADLTNPADRRRLLQTASEWQGGINVLVNNAGINHFRLFEDQSPEQIDLALAVNLQAPLHLCRLLLPQLAAAGQAHIVNMGSVFGSIGYPAYAVYSATKFAMRGFTEALRRELAGGPVKVHYLAPRATRTPINTAAVDRMNADLGTATDPPERVAEALCRMLERDEPERVIGWPEKFFVRLNGALPRLVDGALVKQLPVIRRYARESLPPRPAVHHVEVATTTTGGV